MPGMRTSTVALALLFSSALARPTLMPTHDDFKASTTSTNNDIMQRDDSSTSNLYVNAATVQAICHQLLAMGTKCDECDNLQFFSAPDLCRSASSDNQRAQTAAKNIAPALKLALGHATSIPAVRQTASTSLLTRTRTLVSTGTLLSAPTDMASSAATGKGGLFNLALAKADDVDEPCDCEDDNASVSASASASATQAVTARNHEALISFATTATSLDASATAVNMKTLMKLLSADESSTTAAEPVKTAYGLARRDILSETSTAYSTSESATPTGGYTGIESNDDGVMDSAQTEYEDSEDMPVYV